MTDRRHGRGKGPDQKRGDPFPSGRPGPGVERARQFFMQEINHHFILMTL
jgi:hypothetical protein